MSNTPNKPFPWGTLIAIVGGFALFALIIAFAYLPQRAPAIPQGALTPEERMERLTEMRAKEAKQANSYSWIDQQKGTVEIPIDRAMELTVQELNAKK
ncbi:MAG TPA: hypothetical protein VFT72_10450 [Opitutaceae bacterium]|nr:hypothetical protein [Opitutaceae bacterium]